MKFFTLLLFTLATSLAFGQNLALPIDFESTTVPYTFDNFNGGMSTVIANPQQTGTNTSANVAQMIKSAGEVWGGSFLTLTDPIDFSAGRTIKMMVHSPRVGARVLLKIEHLTDGAIFSQLEDTLTTANTWEELSFDFRWIDVNQAYSKIVLIFDFGVMGDGSSNFTFLFDDIRLVDEGPYPTRTDLPITFEDPDVDYTLTAFEGNYATLSTDPNGSSNKVAKTVKRPGATPSAGTTVGTIGGLLNPIPITAAETRMNVRVYTPRAGIPVRLKIEDANDPTRSVETQVNTTVGNTWETLEFDFSNEAPGTAALNLSYTFNMVSIFFHFGTDGASVGADSTFYFDDIRFGEATTGISDMKTLGLAIYPNPIQHDLYIQSERRLDEIRIYNQMGQLVLFTKGAENHSVLNVSKLSPGIYVVKVKIGKEIGVLKLIKS